MAQAARNLQGGSRRHRGIEGNKTLKRQIKLEKRGKTLPANRGKKRLPISSALIIDHLKIAKESRNAVKNYGNHKSIRRQEPFHYMTLQLEWAQHEGLLSNADCAVALLALNRTAVAKKNKNWLAKAQKEGLWKTAVAALRTRKRNHFTLENEVQEKIKEWNEIMKSPDALQQYLNHLTQKR
ncbi:hypothetical protein KKE06_04800 [Candidatus Micrarchaeota archaeon]|nr:hypothetical protein [Candidatus Micrarchaeota archaeon]MBU1931034.1 hypothetical protein [Candidatus Micrarchaeota archaeon]